MVNLRKRASVSQKVSKRTSSRATQNSPSKISKNYNEIIVDNDFDDSEGDEDIVLEGSEGSKLTSESDLLEGYASDLSISFEDNEEREEESEDDKEIRRIIEKTEAETKNIPLTARQRAKLEGNILPEINEALPVSGTLTDEQALMKSEKSRRKKLQRDAKIEETKRATIDRLLQKQKKVVPEISNDSNLESGNSKEKKDKSLILESGYVRFIENNSRTILQFPDELTFQLALSEFNPRHLCKNSLCEICGKNQSKYVHPVKGKLFCSVKCYKFI